MCVSLVMPSYAAGAKVCQERATNLLADKEETVEGTGEVRVAGRSGLGAALPRACTPSR